MQQLQQQWEVSIMATQEQKDKAHTIIHGATVAAAAASGAMAQGAIFGADTAILTGIHVGMVAALGELFGQSVTKQAAMAILGTYAGAGVGIYGVKALLGWFPGIGNAANATISGGYTEALGWWCFKYFDEKKEAVCFSLKIE